MQRLRDVQSTSELVLLKKRALNDRLMLAERGFLDSDGLEGRHWFKHLVSTSVFLGSLKLMANDYILNCSSSLVLYASVGL